MSGMQVEEVFDRRDEARVRGARIPVRREAQGEEGAEGICSRIVRFFPSRSLDRVEDRFMDGEGTVVLQEKDKPNSTTMNGSPGSGGIRSDQMGVKIEPAEAESLSTSGSSGILTPVSPYGYVKPISPEQEELIHRLVYFQNEYEQPSEEDLKRITVSLFLRLSTVGSMVLSPIVNCYELIHRISPRKERISVITSSGTSPRSRSLRSN